MPTWNESLRTNNELIDSQHQELCAAIDKIQAAMQERRSRDEIENFVKFLREYCQMHFLAEEGLMAQLRYPDILAHQNEHLKFLNDFRSAEVKLKKEGPNAVNTIAIVQMTSRWFIDHVMKNDVRVAKFVRGEK